MVKKFLYVDTAARLQLSRGKTFLCKKKPLTSTENVTMPRKGKFRAFKQSDPEYRRYKHRHRLSVLLSFYLRECDCCESTLTTMCAAPCSSGCLYTMYLLIPLLILTFVNCFSVSLFGFTINSINNVALLYFFVFQNVCSMCLLLLFIYSQRLLRQIYQLLTSCL